MCSFIVHLHLNRSPRLHILPHPKQSVWGWRSRLFLPRHVCAEHICKAVIDIERRLEINLRIHKTAVQLCGDGISLLVNVGKVFPNGIAVEVDCGNALDVAFIGHLIAIGVKPIPGAAMRNKHLGVSQISHVFKGVSNALTLAVQADLSVHINGKLVLRCSDTFSQHLTLIQHIEQEPGNLRNLLGILSAGDVNGGFILRLGHALDRTLRLCVGTWEGDMNSLSANFLNGVARLVVAFGDSIRDDLFKEKVGFMSVKQLSRTAKERRPGFIGYSEAMLVAYNRKCKYPLRWNRLYEKNLVTTDGLDVDVALPSDEVDKTDEPDNAGE